MTNEFRNVKHPSELWKTYRDSARFTFRFILILVSLLLISVIYFFLRGL